MIGIIVSTGAEADTIISELYNKKNILIQNKLFIQGNLEKKKKIIIGICGVGKTNASHCTSLLIEKYKPHIIFNIGIAGAYPSSGLKVGDLAVAEKEIYGDEGLIAKDRSQKTNFYTMDKISLPLATVDGINYYNEFPMFVPEDLNQIRKGNFVTISTITGTLRQGREIEKRFNALCENMEGAAVAHICLLAKIPVTEIRGISNIIKDRRPEPLKRTHIIKASRICQDFLIDYLKHSDL